MNLTNRDRMEAEEMMEPAVDKDRVIAKLREHEAELKGIGITHLSLFGSKARGDDSAQSDGRCGEEILPAGYGVDGEPARRYPQHACGPCPCKSLRDGVRE
jgi:hypothetical protein